MIKKGFIVALALFAAMLSGIAQESDPLYANLKYEEGICTKDLECLYIGSVKDSHGEAKGAKRFVKQTPKNDLIFKYKGKEYLLCMNAKCKLPPLNEGDRAYISVNFYEGVFAPGTDSLPYALVDEVTMAAVHYRSGKDGRYKTYVYLDYLNRENISGTMYAYYYDSQKKSSFKSTAFVDDAGNKTDMQIYSKKAQDGFLFINKAVMDRVVELGCMDDAFKVDYVLNGRFVADEESVLRLVALKRAEVQVGEIVYDKEAGRMTVYVTTKQ